MESKHNQNFGEHLKYNLLCKIFLFLVIYMTSVTSLYLRQTVTYKHRTFWDIILPCMKKMGDIIKILLGQQDWRQ